MACGSVAWTLFGMGDTPSAAAWAIASIVGSSRLRDRSTTISLPIGALIALEAGRPEEAAVIMGAFGELSERYGIKPPVGLAILIRRSDPVGRITASLEPDVLAAAMERGRRMSLGEAVELVKRIGDEAGWRPRSSPADDKATRVD